MRPWASWTAKTALLAAGFAAAGGGLSGVALAGPGGSSTPGTASVLGNTQLLTPRGIPASVCADAGALLGIARAACLGGATANLPAQGPRQTGLSGMTSGNVPPGGGRAVSIPLGACGNPAAVLGDSTAGCAGGAMAAMTGSTDNGSAGSAVKSAVAPVTSALGASGPLAGLRPVSGLAPLSSLTGSNSSTGSPQALAIFGARGTSAPAPGPGGTFINSPGAGSGAGDPNVPAASALAGLGALPGLADLPSLAGLANTPALNGVMGRGIPMPGTTLSAANAPGMSSNSFAALAVGALLAGASALKIAGRRARDRKAGIGVAV